MRFLLMNLHVIFIMLSCFLCYQNLRNRNKDSFFNLLLLLSGDISLNPGPSHMNQTSGNNEWDVFTAQGLHFTHININSFLPKLEELCGIASLMQLLLEFQNQNLTTP